MESRVAMKPQTGIPPPQSNGNPAEEVLGGDGVIYRGQTCH